MFQCALLRCEDAGSNPAPDTMEILLYILSVLFGVAIGIHLGVKIAGKWMIEYLRDEGLLSDEEKTNTD